MKDYIEIAKEKMEANLEAFKSHLRKIRTGQADKALIDSVLVPYYGQPTPIVQIASISKPEPRVLLIAPFEKNSVKDIEQALIKANLGVTPISDGKFIRLVMPELTEERREILVKETRKLAEKCRVDLRMSRRVINDELKVSVKDKTLTEDDQRRLNDDLQKLTDDCNNKIDQLLEVKKKEILGH